MRIAHILKIDAKGEAVCVARGPYDQIKSKFADLKLGKGESFELWSPGWLPKKRNEHRQLVFTKKESPTREALEIDLRKLGRDPKEIEKALAASKLPSIHDKVKKAAALLIAFCLLAFSVTAQQPVLNNINGATTAGASTNSSAGNGFIGWNIDQVAVFQGTIIGTNSSPTNAVTVYWDTSDNGTDWLADQYSLSITPNGTNSVTAITRITNSVGGKYLRFGKIENANATAVTFTRFTLSTKQQ